MEVYILGYFFLTLTTVGLFSRHIGTPGIKSLLISAHFFCLLLTFWGIYQTRWGFHQIYYNFGCWVSFREFVISITFFFDKTTWIMLATILVVSLIVHLYSIFYLSTDPHQARFFCYLSLFTLFMLILVTSGNLIQMFIGWEGVGLMSYLLIAFWYTRIQAIKAALKAVFVNKIGDICFLIGCSFFLGALKTVELPFFILSEYWVRGPATTALVIGFFFFLAAATVKSAQFGFHIWLPDAMEGPTPVSALLHAATMVTAGVFLMIRFNTFIGLIPGATFTLVIIGTMTSLFAATTASCQTDIKRVIAFSTCSQLGYMFLILGLQNPNLALFHLFNHAFFKALLFLTAGSVIHALQGEQDLRRMGGLAVFLPLTFTLFCAATLALLAFPPLSGFFSKDPILVQLEQFSTIFGLFGLLSAGFTVYYNCRLIYFIFFATPNFFRAYGTHIHETPLVVQCVLSVLFVNSLFSGFLFYYLFLDPQTIEGESATWLIRSAPLLSFFLSLLVSFGWLSQKATTFFYQKYAIQRVFFLITWFFNQRWFFDRVYSFCTLSLGNWAYFLYVWLDKILLEQVGGSGLSAKIFNPANQFVTRSHQGLFSRYLFVQLLVFVGFLIVLWLLPLVG